MLIALADYHIFIIPEGFINIFICQLLEIIRFPVCFAVFLIAFHQRIIRSPPQSEKSSAFSIYDQISQIIRSAQGKVPVQNPSVIQLMQIIKSFLCFFCQRSVNNFSVLTDPSLRICPKTVKHRIYRITGACGTHKICVTCQTHRSFSIFRTHSVLYKSIYDLKSIFKSFRLLQPQLLHPVLSQPQKIRSVVDHCFRNSHQPSVEFSGVQKGISIAFIHLFDSWRHTFLKYLCKILHKIIFHQLLQNLPVCDHHYIRKILILYQNIYKFTVALLCIHIYGIILYVQHFSKVSGIGIILIGISFRKIGIIGSADLGKSIGYKLRIRPVGCCFCLFHCPSVFF